MSAETVGIRACFRGTGVWLVPEAEFIKDVLRSISYEIGVPHLIWHYLDDADIRIRDPRYAEAQVLAVRQSIDEWA